MAKRKKLTKAQVEVIALQETIGELARQFEEFKTKTRYDFSHYNTVISQQTDRVGKQNGQVDQMVRQVNAGFEQVKQDLIRAGQGLQSHERDIANLQQRILTLESAQVISPGKSTPSASSTRSCCML